MLILPKRGGNGASQGERGGGGKKEEKASFTIVYSAGGYQGKEASASIYYNGVGPTFAKRP